MICDIGGNDHFYINILIFIEKELWWDFCKDLYQKKCFLRSVEYDV